VLPPYCGGYILWHPHMGVLPASFQLFSDHRSHCNSCVHIGDSHVKPLHLQPEEWRR
jgi:hypothetical protein